MTDKFYVLDSKGQLVPAKILVDNNGTPVVNNNYNNNYYSTVTKSNSIAFGVSKNLMIYSDDKGTIASSQEALKYAIVPYDFDLNKFLALALEKSNSGPFVEAAFWVKGEGNFQLNHSDGDAFILSFTDSNSIILGMVESLSFSKSLSTDANIFNTILGVQPTERNRLNQQTGRSVIDKLNFATEKDYVLKHTPTMFLDPDFINSSLHCFLSDTPVLMADGTEKPIEEIEIGDEVMAFDPLANEGKGQKTSRKVTRLFRNVTNKILDLHGLKMTPGHVVLTDQGEWLTIARVLKADRAIVKEIDGKPVEIRARTGRPIGSAEDIPVNVVFRDPVTRRQQVATVRAGIPAIAHTYAGKTELWTLGKVLAHQNYKLEADGTIFDASGAKFDATPWPGSTPFESEIMHNWIISVEGRSYTPQWIADLPLEDEKNASTAGAAQDSASYGSPQTMNRHERRRMAALHVVK